MAKSPPYPREIIREDVLTELKPIVAEAALRIGVFRVRLSRVINRHAGIDPNLAVRAGIGPNLAVRLERAGAGDGSPCRGTTTSPEGSRTIPTG